MAGLGMISVRNGYPVTVTQGEQYLRMLPACYCRGRQELRHVGVRVLGREEAEAADQS